MLRFQKNRCINFDKFQIGKTTKAEGTGTGMVYVQSTLKEMDSILFIKSKPKEGTEIEIHLKNLASAEID
ncbi:MAG: ATP-binding protein [Spirochaetota bacterium]